MIVVDNLTKRFGQHSAVQSVSFSVSEGETLGLLGPNGAGKTTVMRMMTGYLPPTEGRVVINDMDMFDQPNEIKKRIGYMPEHPPLYHEMTVREFLEFAGLLRGMEKASLRQSMERVAGMCGIADMLGRLIGNLSKGYRQRVGLAQALVHDPEILILDEPTVGLDPKQIIEIRELIRDLGRERTVVLSSHILYEVTSICQKVAIINEGKLLAYDTIDNLSDSLRSGQTLVVTLSRPDRVDIGMIRQLPHVVNVDKNSTSVIEIRAEAGHDIRDAVSRYLLESDAGLLEMKTETMSLEDIFLKVITGEK
jgi:ABC-2 type transport system ATP-binding protein